MPTTVDTEELCRLLAEGVQLVDVLPAATYVQEHLPGAVNVPLGDIAEAPRRLDSSRPVAVYCYDYQ
jgi:rhodanese-related sulfurtransferase